MFYSRTKPVSVAIGVAECGLICEEGGVGEGKEWVEGELGSGQDGRSQSGWG